MTNLILAEIPYLNCAPFYWRKNFFIPGVQIEWLEAHPRELGHKILRGEIDAGPVSLLNIPEISEKFDLIPLGISAVEDARSVILFSKKPLKELDGESVGLTPQSVTSTELLRLILRDVYQVAPIYQESDFQETAAELLIGDQALFALEDPGMEKKFPYRLDLGRAWRKWKGHSFVFARWMVRKGLPKQIQESLEDWLSENVRLYKENPTLAIRAFEKMRGWQIANTREYLASFDYRPSESDFWGSLAPFPLPLSV